MNSPSSDRYREERDPTRQRDRNWLEVDLPGYLLGALDTDESLQVERMIEQSPDLRRELIEVENRLAPLQQLDDKDRQSYLPPAGLARRTCETIANSRASGDRPFLKSCGGIAEADALAHPFGGGTSMRPPSDQLRQVQFGGGGRGLSIRDLGALAAAILLLTALAIPFLNNSRFQARVATCQNNLREVGLALLRYADSHNGRFVPIPREDKLAVAGAYAPALLSRGLVEDQNVFFCASRTAASDAPREIPSFDQVLAADEAELVSLQRRLGGDYGYSLGYYTDGQYQPPHFQSHAGFVLVADSPSVDNPGRRSQNHGGYGQNCLFEDGHYALIKNSSIAGDAIYENDRGLIAPGTHALDSVIAPSHVGIGF